QRKKFFANVKYYIWEDPYLYKLRADQVIRKCVPESEMQGILSHCHDKATRGYFGAIRTANKVFQSRFYWPTLFKDAHRYVTSCNQCQRSGNVSQKHELPLTNILVCECMGNRLYGTFPKLSWELIHISSSRLRVQMGRSYCLTNERCESSS